MPKVLEWSNSGPILHDVSGFVAETEETTKSWSQWQVSGAET